MNLSIITAHSLNYAIGKNNQLLWRLPKDMAFFKQTTIPHAILMGRKTYESLGKWKPLPDRINIIITKNKGYVPENANDKTHVCHSFKEAVVLAIRLDCEKIFVGGGGEIYREALEQQEYPVTEAIITEVQAEVDGDTFFPDIKKYWTNFQKETLLSHKKDDKHFADFNIIRYYRWIV